MSVLATIVVPAAAAAACPSNGGPGPWSGMALGLGAGLVAGSMLAWQRAARRWRALEATLALGRALVDAGRPLNGASGVPAARARPRMTPSRRVPVAPATASRRVGVPATEAPWPAASTTASTDRRNARGSGSAEPRSDASHDGPR